MNSFETVLHHYVLLFWYIGERNWTVQSTSSIVKPRKEAEEYRAGDIVLAKFQGKPYNAVIISIKAEKDNLKDEKIRFDQLLRDANLTPSEILKEMGLSTDLNTDSETENGKSATTISNKRPAKKLAEKNDIQKKKKTSTSNNDGNKISEMKQKDKQKKMATLESSKLMAARLLQKTTCTDQQPCTSLTVTSTTFQHSPTNTPPAVSLPINRQSQQLDLNTSVTTSSSVSSNSVSSLTPLFPKDQISNSSQIGCLANTSCASSSDISSPVANNILHSNLNTNTSFENQYFQASLPSIQPSGQSMYPTGGLETVLLNI